MSHGRRIILGFGHFLQQSDIVTKTLMVILTVMSTIWASAKSCARNVAGTSWPLLGRYVIGGVQNSSLHGVRSPGRLTAHSLHAQAHHAKLGTAKLEETGSEQEFLTRTIKKVLVEETTSLGGLTMLATIGATAPFVAVRHGMGRLSRAGGDRHVGPGMLDKVAVQSARR